jgi:hypothetical protein
MKSKELLIEKVKRREHLTEETNSLNHLRFSRERVSRLIEILNFHSTNWILSFFTDDFVSNFNHLSLNEKLEVAEVDESGIILLLIIIVTQDFNEVNSLTNESMNSQISKDFLLVYALEQRNISLIPHGKPELLYEYFVFAEIEPSEALQFADSDFLKVLFEKLLVEKQVLYSKISHNLILLMSHSVIDPKKETHASFMEKLFIKEDYIQGGVYQILVKAIELLPLFLIQLSKVRLSIDPFTRSTNYSKWLNESNKFRFLLEQFKRTNVVDVIQSKEYSDFQFKLEAFNKFCPY